MRDEGYRADHAHDRTSALASIDRHVPALILLDHTLADLPASRLRADLARPHGGAIPVVTMTTSPAVATASGGCAVGRSLLKPFTLDELLTCVANAIR